MTIKEFNKIIDSGINTRMFLKEYVNGLYVVDYYTDEVDYGWDDYMGLFIKGDAEMEPAEYIESKFFKVHADSDGGVFYMKNTMLAWTFNVESMEVELLDVKTYNIQALKFQE